MATLTHLLVQDESEISCHTIPLLQAFRDYCLCQTLASLSCPSTCQSFHPVLEPMTSSTLQTQMLTQILHSRTLCLHRHLPRPLSSWKCPCFPHIKAPLLVKFSIVVEHYTPVSHETHSPEVEKSTKTCCPLGLKSSMRSLPNSTGLSCP